MPPRKRSKSKTHIRKKSVSAKGGANVKKTKKKQLKDKNTELLGHVQIHINDSCRHGAHAYARENKSNAIYAGKHSAVIEKVNHGNHTDFIMHIPNEAWHAPKKRGRIPH